MSTPASRLTTPAHGTRLGAGVPAPAPLPPRRPDRTTPSEVPVRRAAPAAARRRRSHHIGFALFAGVLLGSMIFGIVVLNALLAQTAFRIDQAERRIEALSEEHLELVREQATLSAPGRIAAWASRHGMRLPDDIRFLHAPGEGSADPAGTDTTSAGDPAA